MNAKKCKALRKAMAGVPNQPPVIPPLRSFSYTGLDGVTKLYGVTGTIKYPSGSHRRIYQDAKKHFS